MKASYKLLSCKFKVTVLDLTEKSSAWVSQLAKNLYFTTLVIKRVGEEDVLAKNEELEYIN